jgi:apolipoprotein N-acyltransferase
MMAEALPAEGASLFERWAGRLAELSGLRRQAAAFASGLLASLALPPLHLVFLLVPAFTALVWLVAGATSPRKAAWIGWGFGFGYFAAGLYWVGIAFLVDADRFALIMPVAVAGLAAGMALFPALALYIVARSGFSTRCPAPRARWSISVRGRHAHSRKLSSTRSQAPWPT